jgi:hypothetical protein
VKAIGSVVKRIKNNGMLPVCMIGTSDFIVEESKAIRGSLVWPLLRIVGFVCAKSCIAKGRSEVATVHQNAVQA